MQAHFIPQASQALLDRPDLQLFASTDIDETCARVARIFKPHILQPQKFQKSLPQLQARMHHVSFGAVSLNRLCYGANVDIDPDALDDFALVQIPLSGQARIQCGNQQFTSTADLASVISPNLRLKMHWSQDCDQLQLRIDKKALENTCAAWLGKASAANIAFAPELDCSGPNAMQMVVLHLLRLAQMQSGDLSALAKAQAEQLVIGTLLSTQKHNYTEAMQAPKQTVAPRQVRIVEKYIEENAHLPITATQLAEVAGVSLRSLYNAFKHTRHTSPLQLLRQVRLERVRQELQQAQQDTNISTTALNWGFVHLGRFSLDYKREFGESPSETRNKNRS